MREKIKRKEVKRRNCEKKKRKEKKIWFLGKCENMSLDKRREDRKQMDKTPINSFFFFLQELYINLTLTYIKQMPFQSNEV